MTLADQLRAADSPEPKKARANAVKTTSKPDTEALIESCRALFSELNEDYQKLVIQTMKSNQLPPISEAAIAKNGMPTYTQALAVAEVIQKTMKWQIVESKPATEQPSTFKTAADELPSDLRKVFEECAFNEQDVHKVHKARWREVVLHCKDAGLTDDGRHELVSHITDGRTDSAKQLTATEALQVNLAATAVMLEVDIPELVIDWKRYGSPLEMNAAKIKTLAEGFGSKPSKLADLTGEQADLTISWLEISRVARESETGVTEEVEEIHTASTDSPSMACDDAPVSQPSTLGDELTRWARTYQAAFTELVAIMAEDQ